MVHIDFILFTFVLYTKEVRSVKTVDGINIQYFQIDVNYRISIVVISSC